MRTSLASLGRAEYNGTCYPEGPGAFRISGRIEYETTQVVFVPYMGWSQLGHSSTPGFTICSSDPGVPVGQGCAPISCFTEWSQRFSSVGAVLPSSTNCQSLYVPGARPTGNGIQHREHGLPSPPTWLNTPQIALALVEQPWFLPFLSLLVEELVQLLSLPDMPSQRWHLKPEVFHFHTWRLYGNLFRGLRVSFP